ncbi:MAG: hypothetical protein K0S76_1016 [Herbinix sp.]|jgi:hypothetical protein|nr:hypothetical protein [Herbinix sp.]
MQNLNFDDGFKEFSINNDPNRVIRFNPADFGIIERINVAYQEIEKATQIDEDIELKADGSPVELIGKAAEIVQGISNTIKKQIDYIFNSSVSEAAFGHQSPLGMVKGVPLYERFLNSIIPVIEKEVKSEMAASQKRIGKYTSQVK